MKRTIPEEHQKFAEDLVFGHTNAVGVHTNGAVDVFHYDNFNENIKTMFNMDTFHDYDRFKIWMENKEKRIYERYSLVSRLKAGFGFDTASTNDLECRNSLLKEELNHRKWSIDYVIPMLEKFALKTLKYGVDAVLGIGEYKIAKKKEQVLCPPPSWANISLEEKNEILRKIGIGSWFENPRNVPSNIPLYLLQNLETEQRKNFEAEAKTMECFYDGNGSVSAVVHKDPRQQKAKFS